MTLPTDASHERVVRALARAGLIIIEGAKHTLAKRSGRRTSIPRHRRIKLTTPSRIVAQAGLTEDEFLSFY